MTPSQIQELRELADWHAEHIAVALGAMKKQHHDWSKSLRACADREERARAGIGEAEAHVFWQHYCPDGTDFDANKEPVLRGLRAALQSAALALQGDRPNASGISRGMAAELAEREATEHADAMSPYRDRRWDDVWLQEFAESYVERVTPLGTPQAIAADLSRAIGDEK